MQLKWIKRKMKVGNVGTTVRDDNECKRTVMERGKKCDGRCVVECLLGRPCFQLNSLKSSCSLEGPLEVKVGAG